MTLRRKVWFAVVLLVFVPVTSMALFSYRLFSDAMERKTSDYYYNTLQETDRKLGYVLAEINSVSDLSITQQVVQQFLKRHLQDNRDPIAGESNEDRQLAANLNNLLLSHPKINSLSLYSNEKLLYASNPLANIPLEKLKELEWYPKMTAALGRPLWLGPFENAALDANPLQLTHSRRIKDYYTLEDIGTLVLTVKTDLLDNLFWEASTLNKGEILLVNDSGTVLFSKSGERLGRHVEFPFLNAQGTVPPQSYSDMFEGAETFVTYMPSAVEGWHLVALTSIDDLMAESHYIRNIAFGLLALSLLCALFFDLAFVSRMVKSIGLVVRGMKQVEIGKFLSIESPHLMVKDETGLLLKGFNRMSGQIGDLIARVEEEQKRKKQAEMQALVAQINPHFIYNSLESINSMAVLQGNREISRMVVSLGKLLRISISENQELIPLAMEMEHVKHYLLIQKYRFEDKIDYEIDVQESLKRMVCMRLIVQPLVENALYHGIERMRGKGFIRIRAFAYAGDLFIEVADNGLGMSEERLTELFTAPFLGTFESKHRHEGVGLRNVHERIRIRFGEPYGMLVCSAQGEGTTVRLRIPATLEQDSYGGHGEVGKA